MIALPQLYPIRAWLPSSTWMPALSHSRCHRSTPLLMLKMDVTWPRIAAARPTEAAKAKANARVNCRALLPYSKHKYFQFPVSTCAR